jgi:GAF domain-containing protein/anti-sigma regulatory factor (Ser/Thr protein kinase)
LCLVMPSETSTASADQSVEELRRELAEAQAERDDAHRREAATAEVLRVISKCTTDVQPVFDAIVMSSKLLLGAHSALVSRVVGRELVLAAYTPINPTADDELKGTYPHSLEGTGLAVYVVREGVPCVVSDTETDDRVPPSVRETARSRGFRSILSVPMLSRGEAIGTINVTRATSGAFSDKDIALLQTFADQAVIAIENTRLFEEVQARTKELTESLESETATSDILNVISRSPTDLQPVFDTIAANAVKLCSADRALIYRFDGEFLRLAASYNAPPELREFIERNPFHPGRGSTSARAALEQRTVQILDLQADPEYAYGARDVVPIRSTIAVPMLKGEALLGVITIYRLEVRPFTDKQISLVETFADQASIAISNVGLFEEVQARTGELQESLEYQTATSDVLNVISRSKFKLQPVLDTIVETAARLCRADMAHIRRREGDVYVHVAGYGEPPGFREFVRESKVELGRGGIAGRVLLEKKAVQIPDVLNDSEFALSEMQRRGNFRTVLGVPLTREGVQVGIIVLLRRVVEPFTEKQSELVTTFADQAVIAIENTRLFEEVQARNRDLRVALEQQTATSELLKVIGRSTFELQPVFDTLAENAVRLCAAERAFVHRFDGQFLSVAATYNVSPELRVFIERNPMAPGRYGVAARAALERRTVHIRDVQADREITFAARDIEPVRTALSVPMLRAGELLGVIMIYRHEVSPFTDSQVALIETFADQAAIAIENTRLLEELQARNRDLTALGEVGRVVSSTLDLRAVLKTIVDRAVVLSCTDGGSIFYFREDIGRFELGETTGLDEETVARFRKLDIATGQTGLGEAIAQRQPLQLPDIHSRPRNPLRDAALEAGLRAALIVPLLSGDAPLGALVLQRRHSGEFPGAVVTLMQAFADQSVIALENARLFEEIAQKSRELEIASQHKSQFVANMSHELRTPLAAILGYAELMQEGFYEPLGQKSLDALTRIRSNGRHLLGLINTVLDIAKIESGQFTLNMTEYAIESVVETVRSATESLAQNKKLALKTEVTKSLPIGLGDEQRLTQVLLNLVGNAIKFTDAGEVRVTAKVVNGHFNVSVTDTGPGIPEEHQARIFEQFHQVDSSNTKAKGGTGLGLAIAKQIVEMHGGRIWVESMLGKGSTFQMELPTRAELRKPAS